jgi:uncharacterized membrane protein YukC
MSIGLFIAAILLIAFLAVVYYWLSKKTAK